MPLDDVELHGKTPQKYMEHTPPKAVTITNLDQLDIRKELLENYAMAKTVLATILSVQEDKDGKVDIEGILSESIDNLVVAQVKKYPNVFSGVEIGGGTIKINIPSFDKQLVFDYNDIESFKQNLLN